MSTTKCKGHLLNHLHSSELQTNTTLFKSECLHFLGHNAINLPQMKSFLVVILYVIVASADQLSYSLQVLASNTAYGVLGVG